MAKAHVEVEFPGSELQKKDSSSAAAATAGAPPPTPRPRLDRRRSFCGISKMNPEIVKSIIANSAADNNMNNFNSPGNAITPTPTVPHSHNNPLPLFPLFSPQSLPSLNEKEPKAGAGGAEAEAEAERGQMTIFYNGTVSVFDLPTHKAKDIINFALGKSSPEPQVEVQQHINSGPAPPHNIDLQALSFTTSTDGDLPIKRSKSLHRFFQKRKDRLIIASPYPMDQVSQKTSI